MTTLFSPPKIPHVQTAAPAPIQNPQLEAELAQIGKRQGFLAALTQGQAGQKTRGAVTKAKLTGG